MSRRPNCFTVSATIRSASAALETSTLSAIALPPAFVISAATDLASSSAQSAITTLAPSLPNSNEVARPIPDPPPVISAILLSSLPISESAPVSNTAPRTPASKAHTLALTDKLGEPRQDSKRWSRNEELCVPSEIEPEPLAEPQAERANESARRAKIKL